MNISIKTKTSINSHLDKIKNDTFQEVDIKLLLIDIREHIREETLLRELADFIAHPSRTRGIFNKKLKNVEALGELETKQIFPEISSGEITDEEEVNE